MTTTLSERGQTAVPAAIRAKFGLRPGQKIEWADDGKVIHLLPVPEDPVKGFRGSLKRNLNRPLMKYRKKERKRERA